MRKLVVVGLVAVALMAACGREGPVGGTTGARDLGSCEWVRDVSGVIPDAAQGELPVITQADVDRVVSAVPDEVKEPISVIFGMVRDLQERTRDVADLSPEEQQQLAAEIVELYRDDSYRDAVQQYAAYLAENCPALMGSAPGN